MSSILDQLEHWEFGAAGILHPTKSTLKRYYELLDKTSKIQGDVAEFGVSRGASLISTGILLKEKNLKKKSMALILLLGFLVITKMMILKYLINC